MVALLLILYAASFSLCNGLSIDVDVTKYGAVGDGETDDSQAFLKAWAVVCATPDRALLVPRGKSFMLPTTKFQGPCSSPSVHFQILGTIVAPKTNQWKSCEYNSWLIFDSIENLVLGGTGKIDGQGSLWWNKIENQLASGGCQRPTALRLHHCNNLRLEGLTHLNSPKNHITLNTCTGVTISNIHISAPQDSPNTDGIDISKSVQVTIRDSVIETGDDCVAINNASSIINVTNVACGPGHGISIGSLGESGAYEIVEDVHVRNCTFTNTQNGVRIKTWPGGSGYAKKITFEQITLVHSKNPIIIDQHYCEGGHDCGLAHDPLRKMGGEASAVKISDVTYDGVQGSSVSVEAISLLCSDAVGCSNIVMKEVNITSAVAGKQVVGVCENAEGTATATEPTVPCLSK